MNQLAPEVYKEKDVALASIMRASAEAVGLWPVGVPIGEGYGLTSAYVRAARRGVYRDAQGIAPAFPEMFGMTEAEFRFTVKMIYG